MRVVTVIIVIDLCSNFPPGSLCAPGTDNPQNLMGLRKMGGNAKEEECSHLIFAVPLLFNKNLQSGDPIPRPRPWGILGGWFYGAGWGEGLPVCYRMFSSIPGPHPLGAITPHHCGNQNVSRHCRMFQKLLSVITAKRKSTLSSVRNPKLRKILTVPRT